VGVGSLSRQTTNAFIIIINRPSFSLFVLFFLSRIFAFFASPFFARPQLGGTKKKILVGEEDERERERAEKGFPLL
jgi:hypothetical protein